MKNNKLLWRWLGFIGWQIYLTAPPIPTAVVSTNGDVLSTGQQQGSVWGHGAYVAAA